MCIGRVIGRGCPFFIRLNGEHYLVRFRSQADIEYNSFDGDHIIPCLIRVFRITELLYLNIKTDHIVIERFFQHDDRVLFPDLKRLINLVSPKIVSFRRRDFPKLIGPIWQRIPGRFISDPFSQIGTGQLCKDFSRLRCLSICFYR